MAIDFWETQRRARKYTAIYLTIFVIITVGMAVGLEFALRQISLDYQEAARFPIISLVFLAITFGAAAFQYSMFSNYGGKYIASSISARPLNSQTTDRQEHQLLNIVEEMALSASIPTPPVYVIPAKQINAFAAGLTPKNAVIAITEGALITLNREEIQGVIAHEIGHIHNGDMKINIRLAAMIMGFFFILYFGIRMLQISSFAGRSRDSRKGGNPVALVALLLLVAGALSWFAGSILKASVSRAREYLADASSVQFTRNPEGLASALHKIALEQHNDMPREGMAFSHMYFDNHLGFNALFATHPSIKKRIEAIVGKKII